MSAKVAGGDFGTRCISTIRKDEASGTVGKGHAVAFDDGEALFLDGHRALTDPVYSNMPVLEAVPTQDTQVRLGPAVNLRVTNSTPSHDGMGPATTLTQWRIMLPLRGAIRQHVRDRTEVLDANTLSLLGPGEKLRESHPEAHGESSIVLEFRADPGSDVVAELTSPTGTRRLGDPLSFTNLLCSRDLFSRIWSLRQAGMRMLSARPGSSSIDLQAAALSVLRDVVRNGLKQAADRRISPKMATARAHAETAEGTKAYLACHMESRMTIEHLGRHVHCSPFHLCRIFRSHTGLSIHKYLTALRLRSAIDRLHEHPSDLAQLATSLGFASHSHFCDAFRREFDSSPSNLRNRLTRGEIWRILDS